MKVATTRNPHGKTAPWVNKGQSPIHLVTCHISGVRMTGRRIGLRLRRVEVVAQHVLRGPEVTKFDGLFEGRAGNGSFKLLLGAPPSCEKAKVNE